MQPGSTGAGLRSKEKKGRIAWAWSWLIIFFAVVGASDYFRVTSQTVCAGPFISMSDLEV